MEQLLSLRERAVYRLPVAAGDPAVYYLADDEAGGILINSPAFDPALAAALADIAPLRFLFYPSRLGARDVDRWRAVGGVESLAFGAEQEGITGTIDIALDSKSKLTRTIDFLPMSGRTRGSGALRVRNLPGVVFFGPTLSPGDSGWPTLSPQPDDYSYENRLFGSLGLQDLRYDYAFTDRFVPGHTQFGPGADQAIQAELRRLLEL